MKTIQKIYELSVIIVKFIKDNKLDVQGWNWYKNGKGEDVFYIYMDSDGNTSIQFNKYPKTIECAHYSNKISLPYNISNKSLNETLVKIESDFNNFKNDSFDILLAESNKRREEEIKYLKSRIEKLQTI